VVVEAAATGVHHGCGAVVGCVAVDDVMTRSGRKAVYGGGTGSLGLCGHMGGTS
jgi:hypothetical protein